MSEENKMEEFVSYVENMTVLELSKLVKTLEERLGVSAAAPGRGRRRGLRLPLPLPPKKRRPSLT